MAPADADAMVIGLMDTWRGRGGPAGGKAMTHRSANASLSMLVAVTGSSGFVGSFIGRQAARTD